MAWALIVVAAAAAVVPFHEALSRLYDIWNLKPEYSHGVLIPPLSAFLIWRERAWLSTARFSGTWGGIALVAAGFGLWYLGELATLFTIQQYAFLIVLYGLIAALIGWQVFRRLWMPLLVLIFMVPLPAFFANTLSLKLQLLSSAGGVALIRLAGISVLLQGNVIDLGSYRLEVVEACDGLRYLFPLMTLAFVLAYFYRAPMWKRVVLFASSIPVAIFLNSFRIGVIGITVEYWGPRMAEGVLHDFEGWVVFMLSTAALLAIAALLGRIGPSRTSLRASLSLDAGERVPKTEREPRRLAPAFVGAAALTVLVAVWTASLPPRVEIPPVRAAFAEYPNTIGPWRGQRETMEKIYLDTLVLDDYLLSNYSRRGPVPPVNLYMAYYDSQRKGQSVHSPLSCLPGGGWDMLTFEQRAVEGVRIGGQPLRVNRAVIELGSQRQVVYYWFQQRGRVLTNEYLVKWYIFWDAITRNRTDGALVRLTAPILPGMNPDAADAEIMAFAKSIESTLNRYVPG